MAETLEKVRRLEKYLEAGAANVDPVVDQAVDKLLEREAARLSEAKRRLETQAEEFEQQYGMETSDFYARYESGQLGDDIDFIEWSATYQMIQKLDKQLALLQADQGQ